MQEQSKTDGVQSGTYRCPTRFEFSSSTPVQKLCHVKVRYFYERFVIIGCVVYASEEKNQFSRFYGAASLLRAFDKVLFFWLSCGNYSSTLSRTYFGL